MGEWGTSGGSVAPSRGQASGGIPLRKALQPPSCLLREPQALRKSFGRPRPSAPTRLPTRLPSSALAFWALHSRFCLQPPLLARRRIFCSVWFRDSPLHPGHGVPLSHRLRTACAPPRAGSLAVAASQNGDIAPLPPAAGLLEWKILPAEKQAKKRKQNITISGDW